MASSSTAEAIIRFNKSLSLDIPLPGNIRVMNPFNDPEASRISSEFYRKYYDDARQRHLILAINPGRFGAGVTGIPFTDTVRLEKVCGIKHDIPSTHEPSSVFVYELIEAFGGPEKFYRDYYIASVCPLGFVRENENGRVVNFNYYDSKELGEAVTPFIVENLRKQLRMNLQKKKCICWGSGKNFRFLSGLNATHGFFHEIIPVDHPRFIMQYRARKKQDYIARHLEALYRVTEI